VTFLSLALILTVVMTLVSGQLFLKKAMETTHESGFGSRRVLLPLGAGIAAMTISFFLKLGLLQHFDLSYLYPFQGISVIIISVAAAIMLHERLTPPLVVGALLISAGIVLVSLS
jgi:uncharacterized membrane protein